MFSKVSKTAFPPQSKPIMVWDGKCGFCHYWIIKWMIQTGNAIEYRKYQVVYTYFKDIEEYRFKEAVRLIMPDGTVYSGPAAAYKSYEIAGKLKWMIRSYESNALFRWFSDWGYQKIAENRYQLFRLTKRMFGKNPRRPKMYWVLYLFIVCAIAIAAIIGLIYLIRQ